MIIMKRMLAVVVSLMVATLSGCGTNEIQNSRSQSLSNEEVIALDLSENGLAKEKTINDICVHSEPLIYKENIYNESGELVQFYLYEYDEFNRYKTIYNYQKNPLTPEMILCVQEDFSYDEYFYYKETTYWQDDGLVTQDIYDTHDNIIMTQKVDRYNGTISNITYTYKYPTDTYMTEEYAYRGEGVNFAYYTIKRFNEFGDVVYIMTQYDDSVTTRSYEYEYDQAGCLVAIWERSTDEDMFGTDRSILETVYDYDEQGLLISEEKNYILNEASYSDIFSNEIKQYEYDDEGRLITETIIQKRRSGYSGFKESVYSIEYIYDEDNSGTETVTVESEILEGEAV